MALGSSCMFRSPRLSSRHRSSHVDRGMASPAPRSLEVVLGCNYTNPSVASAGIYVGITNDATRTFNYYINKYMIARLRYSYTNVRDRRVGDLTAKRHVNLIEARLQIIF